MTRTGHLAPLPQPLHVARPLLPPLDRLGSRLAAVWESGQLTNGGDQSRELAMRLTQLLGAPHVALTSNGTSALILALRALELGNGREGEVVTTPFTFPATPHAVVWNGLEPVFADVDPHTGNLDPAAVEARITPRTRAILAVHVYGTPCDVHALQAIADRHGLRLVYDAAHACGATIDGAGIGGYGDLSAFSLHSTKLLHSGEGGALATRDPELMARVECLRNFGITPGGEIADEVGLNGKMSELQAALGLAVLEQLAVERRRREDLAGLYHRELAELPGLTIMTPPDRSGLSLVYFVVRIDGTTFGIHRDELLDRLRDHNVFARRYFHPLCSDLPPYRHLPSAQAARLPVAQRLAEQVLCLPFHGAVTEEQALRVCAVIQASAEPSGSRRRAPQRRLPRPLVSVTMPAFDNAAHIEQAVDSVLAQSFRDLELIVVDDGSRDRTRELLRRYDDPRLTIIEQRHSGGAEATNAALRVARGEWVALFAADDVCQPERLERQLSFAREEQARAVFTWVDFIDEQGAPHPGPHFAQGYFNHPDRTPAEMLRHFFFKGNYLCTPSALIERQLLHRIGGFSPTLAQLPDFAAWLRLIGEVELRILPERLLRYRIRDGDANVSSRANQVRSHYESRRVYRDAFDSIPLALFREAFARDLRRSDCAPGVDQQIEKALLYLRHPVPEVRLLAPDLLSDLLRDPAARERARQRYDLGLPELFELSLGLDVGHAAEHSWLLETVLSQGEHQGGASQQLEMVLAEYRKLEGYSEHLHSEIATKDAAYAQLEAYARDLERRLAPQTPTDRGDGPAT